MIDCVRAVSQTAYPGRGILAAKTLDGKRAAFAYFIMGRSENSRNRVFEHTQDGIRTRAYDESKMKDPSLIIYRPVRALKNHLIVTNGDQTDTVYEYLSCGKTFTDALNTRTFEPDAPNFTPRISLLATFENNDFSVQLGILKAADETGERALRAYYLYDGLRPGEGLFLHTYMGDGNPLPCFTGEPERVEMDGTAREISEKLWQGLNRDNRVSLWVMTRNLVTGETETLLTNAHN